MDIKKIHFYADGLCLNGTLHIPKIIAKTGKTPVVIGSHGLLSDGGSPKQKVLAEKLDQFGIAFFRFDHRGRGKSEGRFSEVTTFEGRLNDMAAAISTVKAFPGINGPLGLFGSSMGGAVCLGIANRFDIKAIVTLAAPVRLSAIRIPAEIDKDPLLMGMNPEQMAFDVSNELKTIKNIMVFHGDADEVVSFSNAEEIYEKACFPKELVRFEKGDHAISNPDFQKQFTNKAVKWLSSHLSGI